MSHEHRFVKEATYYYVNASGSILWRKIKSRCACGGKTFKIQRRLSGTTYVNGLGNAPKVPYNLAAVSDAVSEGHPIWIVDGEKDVETLRDLGEVATCPPDGATSWHVAYGAFIDGATEIRVICDVDEPGRILYNAVRESTSSRVLYLHPAEGKDVTEHIAAGLNLTDLTGDRFVTKGLAAGLAAEFSRAMLRPEDSRLPGPDEFEVPKSWPRIAPEPDSSAAQRIRAARTAVEGVPVPPHDVPWRCGGCGGFLMVEMKSGQGRTCHRCRVTYVTFRTEVDE